MSILPIQQPASDFVWFLFVELPKAGYVPAAEKAVWSYSPFGRWFAVQPDELPGAVTETADPVIVFQYDATEVRPARELRTTIQSLSSKPKTLVLGADTVAQRRFVSEFRESYSRFNGRVEWAPIEDAKPTGMTGGFLGALRKLGVLGRLKPYSLEVHVGNPDPLLRAFLANTGEASLARLIERYFPGAEHARVFPVKGGWSGIPLCRFYVDGRGDEFFLKLHKSPEKYAFEFLGHRDANRLWLGSKAVAAVEIRDVPLAERQGQALVFAGENLAICYESASDSSHQREMWRYLFGCRGPGFNLDVLKRVLAILAQGNERPKVRKEIAWELENHPNTSKKPYHRRLPLTLELRCSIEYVIEDLERYSAYMCDELCGGTGGDWNQRKESLDRLVKEELPHWLAEKRVDVAIGHVHGDPNPRNCMVKNDEAGDVQLIDCGDYIPLEKGGGRLVWDLAILERDIKLLLMETEEGCDGYHDLDVTRLARWCALEQRLATALRFTKCPEDGLIGEMLELVRGRGTEVCELAGDHLGIHYFAALLYGTLEMIKEPPVRRVKKLLALYSATEILKRFESI